MNQMAKFFIDNHKFTTVIMIGVVVFGVLGLQSMNSESFPSVSFAMGTVTTVYDGASAMDIETKITKPLEDEIRQVTGLKDVRSTSQAGLSTIFIRVDMDNVPDVDAVMSDIQKAIDRTTQLPNDLQDPPKFLEIKSEEFPVVEIALTGTNENRKRDLIAEDLKEEIEDIRDVKGVRLVGHAPRRFQVKLNTHLLDENHIGVTEVLDKISMRNKNIPGGGLKSQNNQQLVRIEGKIKDSQDLKEMLIRSNFSGRGISLGEIAQVTDGQEEINVLTNYAGKDSTLLIISKKAGVDTISLVSDIQKRLNNYIKRYGEEVKFNIFHNESNKVKNRLEVLSSNALSGLVLVIVFLFIFLPGRIGLVASLSLPLAVMATMGMMPKFGMNLDAITVLALVIALGMLVDNSVVISENFTRLKKEGESSESAAVKSISQLWLPISATAFTTIAAFLPMLVTKGIMGEFIRWIPVVVTLSLLISLGESFFLLPMRLVHWGGELKEKATKNDWFYSVEQKFEKFMSFALRRRYLMAVSFSVIIVFSYLLMFVFNKQILFPAEETELYIARVIAPRGTRVEQTNEYLKKLDAQVRNAIGEMIDHTVNRAGTSKVSPNDPKAQDGNNVGMMMIYVNEHTTKKIPHTEVLSKLRTIKMPELEKLNFEAMVNGPPVGNPIEAVFRSTNIAQREKMMDQIKDEMGQIPGVINLSINEIIGDDEVYVDIDHHRADQLGLNVNIIGTTIRTALSGKIASTVTLKNKEVDILLRFNDHYRRNLQDLGKINIMDGRGNLVPLHTLAKFRVERGSPQINRYDYKWSKTLTGDVDEKIITAKEANKKLVTIFNRLSPEFPDVSVVYGGVAESTNESMASLMEALVISLIGIFALLVFLFRSYMRPLIIMSTIPLGLFGLSIAFYLHGRPVSFLALIGVIGLGGIIVNSGIVLISFIDQMRDESNMSLNDILVRSSGMRLRAVMVTSLTTISGLLPTAYGIGGSDAILIPMTMAMAWGLTSGTVLTLVWVPCAYAILEDVSHFLKSRVLPRQKSQSGEMVHG